MADEIDIASEDRSLPKLTVNLQGQNKSRKLIFVSRQARRWAKSGMQPLQWLIQIHCCSCIFLAGPNDEITASERRCVELERMCEILCPQCTRGAVIALPPFCPPQIPKQGQLRPADPVRKLVRH